MKNKKFKVGMTVPDLKTLQEIMAKLLKLAAGLDGPSRV